MNSDVKCLRGENLEPSKPEAPDPGVFLVKGDSVSIPSFSISIDEEGKINAEPVMLHTGIDMTPYWLNIAYQHLKATEIIHKKLMLAKEEKNDSLIGEFLKKESSSGMQAIMASGIAIDAYYASVKEHVKIPKSTAEAWKKNSTARYKQISEVIRMGFGLSASSSKSLREILKQNLTFRDKAVHPSAGTAKPFLHVELNKVTDWRYATFRLDNAKVIYGLTLSVIFQTVSKPSDKTPKSLRNYSDSLVVKLKPSLRKWERKYGKLC